MGVRILPPLPANPDPGSGLHVSCDTGSVGGVTRPPIRPNGPYLKERVLAAHRANPQATNAQIAATAKCHPQTVAKYRPPRQAGPREPAAADPNGSTPPAPATLRRSQAPGTDEQAGQTPDALLAAAAQAEDPASSPETRRQIKEIVAGLAFAAGFEWGSNAGLNTGTKAAANRHRDSVMPPDATPRYHAGFEQLAEAKAEQWDRSWKAGFRFGLETQWAANQRTR